MLRILFLFLLLAPSAFAAGSLERSDYVGNWTNTHPITKGESNTLKITDQHRVSFTRSFSNDHPDQNFATDSNGIQFVNDLAIIEFHWDSGELAYKLVLSGWTTSGRRMIFGTMYMYRGGELFNGLPISFEAKD
jgi:hypothetical protein